MKHLLTLRDEDLFENVTNLSPEGWFRRRAVRAVLLGEGDGVYLLHMSARGYHKLPGGGINKDESVEEALLRELLEEIGCPAVVQDELGEIVEYRNQEEMEQHSYCYIAMQSGPLVNTALGEGEIDAGARPVFIKSIDEAISLLESDTPESYEGRFIRQRDLMFLREVKSLRKV